MCRYIPRIHPPSDEKAPIVSWDPDWDPAISFCRISSSDDRLHRPVVLSLLQYVPAAAISMLQIRFYQLRPRSAATIEPPSALRYLVLGWLIVRKWCIIYGLDARGSGIDRMGCVSSRFDSCKVFEGLYRVTSEATLRLGKCLHCDGDALRRRLRATICSWRWRRRSATEP